MLIRTETVLMLLKGVRPSLSEVDSSGSHLSIVGYKLCGTRPELIVIDHRLTGTIEPGKATAPKGLLLYDRGRTGGYLSLASEHAEPKDHNSAVSLTSSVILWDAPRDGGGLRLEGNTEVRGVLGPHRPVPGGMYPADLLSST